MGGPFNDFVRKARYFIIVILTIIGLTAIGIATQIGPLTEPDEMLPEDHPIMVTGQLLQNTFSKNSDQAGAFMVSIVWGVKDLDRSNVGLWDPTEIGELVWDEDFDIVPADNQ